MLERTDRVCLAVPDTARAAEDFATIFDTAVVDISLDKTTNANKIWQITFAVPELKAAIAHYSSLFGLEETFSNYYTSDNFGYEGAITWFDAREGGLLDSLEYLEPNDDSKAVARFVRRNGNGIYMASVETDDIPAIRERVTSTGDGWQGTDFGGFIHPGRLHGLLLGLVTYRSWDARRPLPDQVT